MSHVEVNLWTGKCCRALLLRASLGMQAGSRSWLNWATSHLPRVLPRVLEVQSNQMCSVGPLHLPEREGGGHGGRDGALLAPVQALQAGQDAARILPPGLIPVHMHVLCLSCNEFHLDNPLR